VLRAVATTGGTEAWNERIRMGFPASEAPVSSPLLAGERFVHILDLAQVDLPMAKAAVEAVGVRTALSVPLRKNGAFRGMIIASRGEVRPYSNREIALLQNFAAQAVIAMENARLLTETREALEQQTATAEVLGVINSSPGDLMPVFDAMLDKAHALCGAERGTLFLYDGEKMKAAVAHGYPADVVEHLRAGVEIPPHHAPLFSGKHVHVPDLTKDNNATGRVVSGRGGVRTNLLVPLFRNGALLGMISCNRTEVRPFSDKEIALIENFAQQAVIAIENARLLNETREALDQQTATAEVLGVINSSPGDLQPVFDAMVERAVALCDADEALVRISDGKLLHLAAAHGEPDVLEKVRELGPASLGGHSQSGMYAFVDRARMSRTSPTFARLQRIAICRLGGPGSMRAMSARGSPSHCARGISFSASSTCTGTRCARSARSRSRCWKVSRHRRSLRSRTPGS
jgi:GAF domain-containing protein